MAEQQKTIRIKNACIIYDVSRATIYRAIKQGKITPNKVGGCTLLSVKQMDELFLGASHSQQAIQAH